MDRQISLSRFQFDKLEKAEDVEDLLHGAATMAFEGDHACAVLLSQRLIGKKEW